jgi:hypothetical protein
MLGLRANGARGLGVPGVKFSRHILYNLSRPEKSRLLMTPLARSAGGYAEAAQKKHPVIFEGKTDPDYQAMLAAIRDYKKKLEEVRRFDMPGFQPREEYVQHMVKYGVLSEEQANSGAVDPYAVDEAYFQSFWHRPREAQGARD